MSKERELLKEFIEFVDSYEFYPTERAIIWEIVSRANAILAQPEQEPVAWMQDDIELYVREEKDIVRGYVIPLYTAPPKREPLTSKLISLGNNCHESFIKGVRFAEKMHSIGGGE